MQISKLGLILVFTFLITFGLTIALQQVSGVSIPPPLAGPLDLGGNKIVNVGAPTASGDAATFGWANSVFQKVVSSTCPVGQGIRAVNADGSVVCESTGPKLLSSDVVAAGYVMRYSGEKYCRAIDGWGRCTGGGTASDISFNPTSFHDPHGGALALGPTPTTSAWGCYANADCTGGWMQVGTCCPSFSCNAPWRSSSNTITSVYWNQCSNSAGGRYSCYQALTCSP